jgi:ankyrin repeat protein
VDLEFHLNLQNGAQVGRRTRAGQATSLHQAAYAGHTDVVKVLLQHGADVQAKDTDGQTPLHKACKCTLSRINKFCI